MIPFRSTLRTLTAAALALACLSAWSDEAAIRRAWAERNPKAPPIDEITKTPMAGLYELRIGSDLVYSDERGDYLLFPSRDQSDGHLIDTRTKTDLTEARVNKLMAVDLPKLPLNDAIKFKQGNGSRKLVVFEDPNCHFCKDVEKSLVALKDVTVYTFLIPILGPDSVSKSRDIWCAKDSAQVWRTWMLSGVVPPRQMGNCDVATLQRNVALAERYRVNGTPALIFEDGSRFSGAVDLERLQKRLDDVSAAARKG